ncbi:hypothetical protein JVX98_27090 [Ensifer sp. PDNC004]|uniref:hypothetical protein n=1 Tax=Ensifer sp. PDNC004 TaxID=2811423 RepID=UPI00196322D4|nr:hypothetical protein [Ensifer sp. PDNC004]QRY67967.1 hypothetical protein JVX98_27090 [Ensifer sp. PDNC004]
MTLEFLGNQIAFFDRPVPLLTKERFFPDHYDLETGIFLRPAPPVTAGNYDHTGKYVEKFARQLHFTTLDQFSSGGRALIGFDVCADFTKPEPTIYLRHGNNIIGSYEEKLLYIIDEYRGMRLSTILVIAKMAARNGPANPDRSVSPDGARALTSAYNWLAARGYIEHPEETPAATANSPADEATTMQNNSWRQKLRRLIQL